MLASRGRVASRSNDEMPKTDRPYSRVYWEALDDPKFVKVWDDDHNLAAWLRLLVAADMAWPASAHLYHGCRRASLKVLCEVGLVDMQNGSRYRIHGLDKERTIRSETSREAANIRHHGTAAGFPPHTDAEYARNAPAVRPQSVGNAERMPSQDEQRQDEQRRDEQSREAMPKHGERRLVGGLTIEERRVMAAHGVIADRTATEAAKAEARTLLGIKADPVAATVRPRVSGPPGDEARILELRAKLADPATSDEVRIAVLTQLGFMGVQP